MAGEGNIHYLRKVLIELVGNHLAEVGGEEFSICLFYVASILNGADDCSISAWSSDALFFECLYQRAFGISSGRLCKMLLCFNVNCCLGLAHFYRRQLLLARFRWPDFAKAVK